MFRKFNDFFLKNNSRITNPKKLEQSNLNDKLNKIDKILDKKSSPQIKKNIESNNEEIEKIKNGYNPFLKYYTEKKENNHSVGSNSADIIDFGDFYKNDSFYALSNKSYSTKTEQYQSNYDQMNSISDKDSEPVSVEYIYDSSPSCPNCNSKKTPRTTEFIINENKKSWRYCACTECNFVYLQSNKNNIKTPPNTLYEVNRAFKAFKENGNTPKEYSMNEYGTKKSF